MLKKLFGGRTSQKDHERQIEVIKLAMTDMASMVEKIAHTMNTALGVVLTLEGQAPDCTKDRIDAMRAEVDQMLAMSRARQKAITAARAEAARLAEDAEKENGEKGKEE